MRDETQPPGHQKKLGVRHGSLVGFVAWVGVEN